MKKIYTILAALLVGSAASVNVKAQSLEPEVIGNEDFSSGYFSELSTPYSFTNGQKVTFTFTNYTLGAEFYQNWLLAVRNDDTMAENGSLCIARPDHWVFGWGLLFGKEAGVYGDPNNTDASLVKRTSNYDWDTFKQEMNGASVKIVVTYDKNLLSVRADFVGAVTSKDYYALYEFTTPLTDETLTAFLSIENSWLVISEAKVENIGGPTSLKKNAKEVKSVKYTNLAGCTTAAPSKGMNIVTVVYGDGSVDTVKKVF